MGIASAIRHIHASNDALLANTVVEDECEESVDEGTLARTLVADYQNKLAALDSTAARISA